MTLTRSVRLALALLAVSGALLAACGDDDSDGASATSAADLEGSTFTVSEVEGEELVDGSTFTIAFDEGAVVAQAGCNTMRAGYTLDEGALSVDPIAMTQMACDEELMSQDEWIAAFLEGGPTVALDGDVLTLTGDDVTVTADRDA